MWFVSRCESLPNRHGLYGGYKMLDNYLTKLNVPQKIARIVKLYTDEGYHECEQCAKAQENY